VYRICGPSWRLSWINRSSVSAVCLVTTVELLFTGRSRFVAVCIIKSPSTLCLRFPSLDHLKKRHQAKQAQAEARPLQDDDGTIAKRIGREPRSRRMSRGMKQRLAEWKENLRAPAGSDDGVEDEEDAEDAGTDGARAAVTRKATSEGISKSSAPRPNGAKPSSSPGKAVGQNGSGNRYPRSASHSPRAADRHSTLRSDNARSSSAPHRSDDQSTASRRPRVQQPYASDRAAAGNTNDRDSGTARSQPRHRVAQTRFQQRVRARAQSAPRAGTSAAAGARASAGTRRDTGTVDRRQSQRSPASSVPRARTNAARGSKHS